MKILWLKTELLHPIDKGGRIRTYHTLRRLSQRHSVTYMTLDDGTLTPAAIDQAGEYCDELIRVPFRAPARETAAFYGDLLVNLGSPAPYALARYRSKLMRRRIAEHVRGAEVDLLICDFLAPSINVPAGLPCPMVLFQHNVEAEIWRRHTETSRSRVKRRYFRLQWQRMRRYEARECRRYDHVIAVSDQDRAAFENDYGCERVSAVPTGVDTVYFAPRPRTVTVGPPLLVFTGSMDWLPNQDAMQFFLDEVLPLIRGRVPGVRVRVVGRSPSQKLLERAEQEAGLEVTGFVPDVRPHIAEADVVIVPIRIGGGTRLKIFEAMAMDRPVVSTRVGAEGLPVEDGTHVLLADAPADFAAAVAGLLEDTASAGDLGMRGGSHVRERFGWERVADAFVDICEDVVRERSLSVR